MVVQCAYEGRYRDRSGELRTLRCYRGAESGTHCMFHDGRSHVENEETVRNAFLEEFLSDDDESFFMGCNIPHIETPLPSRRRLIHFNNAIFHGSVSFHNMRADLADFSGARFLGRFEMHACTTKRTVFNGSSFIRHGADDSDPHEDVMFNICTLDELDMEAVTADATVGFDGCKIKKSSFRKCKFNRSLSVEICHFSEDVDFQNTSFSAGARFIDTTFGANALFRNCGLAGHMEFHHVDFQDQRGVTMPDKMYDVSLLGTDVERVRFGADTRWETEDRQPMLDVRNIENGAEKSLTESIFVCRRLRENSDYHLAYSDGGKFFRWEMELRRKYRDDGGIVRNRNRFARALSLRNLYKLASGYGDGVHRVLALWPTLFASAFTYFIVAPDAEVMDTVKSMGGCWYGDPCGHHPVFDAVLERVLNVMGQVSQSEPAGHAFRALTLLLIGISYISVRRRLERRFRH